MRLSARLISRLARNNKHRPGEGVSVSQWSEDRSHDSQSDRLRRRSIVIVQMHGDRHCRGQRRVNGEGEGRRLTEQLDVCHRHAPLLTLKHDLGTVPVTLDDVGVTVMLALRMSRSTDMTLSTSWIPSELATVRRAVCFPNDE